MMRLTAPSWYAQFFTTQADALTVRATLDWVLFHRRRDRRCGAAPTEPVLEQRRYQIHHLHAKTERQVRSARAAVIGADVAAIRKVGFAPIGAVAFEGGRSTIATPTDALLADWQRFTTRVSEPTQPWLRVVSHQGFEALQAAYLQMLGGRSDPQEGHVFRLD